MIQDKTITADAVRVIFVKQSANEKTGPIPVTYSARSTCPHSCPQYGAGCYADAGYHTRLAWNRVDRDGIEWEEFCSRVAALPDGELWRHNVAGDLPGENENVDPVKLGQLVAANRGKRGFTYSHKKTPDAVRWIKAANEWGFTINLSADNAGEADKLAELNAGPVVAIVPIDNPEKSYTPGGRKIIVCPAQSRDGVTCKTCGLCARADRNVIIGFRAHGVRAKIADSTARKIIPIIKG